MDAATSNFTPRRTTERPRKRVTTYVPGFDAWFAFLLPVIIVIPFVLTQDLSPLAEHPERIPWLIGGAVVWMVGMYLHHFRRFEVSSDGVTLVRPWRRKTVSWKDIQFVSRRYRTGQSIIHWWDVRDWRGGLHFRILSSLRGHEELIASICEEIGQLQD